MKNENTNNILKMIFEHSVKYNVTLIKFKKFPYLFLDGLINWIQQICDTCIHDFYFISDLEDIIY